MADTRVQRNAALWVRENWLPQRYGISFRNEAVALSSGGQYRFDAISEDNSTVAAISTSRATRASGGLAVGKLNKIRADMFFLLLARAQRRLLVLSELEMYERCLAERDRGRVPDMIEIVHAQLPEQLSNQLKQSREEASLEVRPAAERT